MRTKHKADKMGNPKDKKRSRWEYREILKKIWKKIRRNNSKIIIRESIE